MDGPTIMRGLIDRGYSPVQAAALAGNALQESGGDPTNINAGEGAHGLIQWRLDRWDNLKKFAADRGASPTDPNVQLDFIGHEMTGPESKSGSAFTAATDLPSANAALKQYIRWGDNSDNTRLNNARGLLGQAPSNSPPSASTSVPASGGSGTTSTPASPPPPDTSVADALAAIPKQIATQDVAPAPIAPLPAAPMITPQMLRARQLSAAMLARSLNPGATS